MKRMVILVAFLILFTIMPFTVSAYKEPYIIETAEQWKALGFPGDLPVYKREALTDFYLPLVVNKETKPIINYRLKHATTSFNNTYNPRVTHKVLQSDNNTVILYHMKVKASNKSWAIDIVPKVNTLEFKQFAWWSSSWDYRKTITISSAQVPTTQYNFPVYINISADANLSAHAQADGGDIAFVDEANTTQYHHEIESYNAGTLVAWVNVTTLAHDSDTNINMYYGNAGCDDQWNINETWHSRYQRVWHLGNVSDRSGNGGDLTNAGADTKTGRTYQYYEHVRANNDNLQYADVGCLGGTGDFFIEVWFNPQDATSTQGLFMPQDEAEIYFDWGVTDTKIRLGAHYSVSGYKTLTSDALANSNWHYAVGAYDSAQGLTLFVNGQSHAHDSTSEGIVDPGGTNYLGMRAPGTNGFDGFLDEVRVSNYNWSKDYQITTYNTIINGTDGGFFSVGGAHSKPVIPATYTGECPSPVIHQANDTHLWIKWSDMTNNSHVAIRINGNVYYNGSALDYNFTWLFGIYDYTICARGYNDTTHNNSEWCCITYTRPSEQVVVNLHIEFYLFLLWFVVCLFLVKISRNYPITPFILGVGQMLIVGVAFTEGYFEEVITVWLVIAVGFFLLGIWKTYLCFAKDLEDD